MQNGFSDQESSREFEKCTSGLHNVIYLPIYLSFIFTVIMVNVCHLRVSRFNLNISTGFFQSLWPVKETKKRSFHS